MLDLTPLYDYMTTLIQFSTHYVKQAAFTDKILSMLRRLDRCMYWWIYLAFKGAFLGDRYNEVCEDFLHVQNVKT